MEISVKTMMAVIPMTAIHVGLMIYALRIINRTRKTKVFSSTVWMVAIIFINIVGPLAFLLFGRTYETD